MPDDPGMFSFFDTLLLLIHGQKARQENGDSLLIINWIRSLLLCR